MNNGNKSVKQCERTRLPLVDKDSCSDESFDPLAWIANEGGLTRATPSRPGVLARADAARRCPIIIITTVSSGQNEFFRSRGAARASAISSSLTPG